jgi:hypothetical protein
MTAAEPDAATPVMAPQRRRRPSGEPAPLPVAAAHGFVELTPA